MDCFSCHFTPKIIWQGPSCVLTIMLVGLLTLYFKLKLWQTFRPIQARYVQTAGYIRWELCPLKSVCRSRYVRKNQLGMSADLDIYVLSKSATGRYVRKNRLDMSADLDISEKNQPDMSKISYSV